MITSEQKTPASENESDKLIYLGKMVLSLHLGGALKANPELVAKSLAEHIECAFKDSGIE